MVEVSGLVKRLAVGLFKIASDIRWSGSGPRCGLQELILPENEPGSSIMPGKVNPTQCESMTMICTQVIGNDTAVSFAGSQGHFQLNVFKPVIVKNVLESINLLGEGCIAFAERCIDGIKPNTKVIEQNTQRTLMLATALNQHIGYHKAAEIVKKAYKEDKTLREAAIELKLISVEEFDRITDPKKMVSAKL
eukprot:c14754_g1_i1.p1 GENE.c14754_g1_i1~~c14754_g1_i1.p1  ORF type:complete len:192 (+),score=59.26 c14754_g1_i1:260-835(+)